MQANNFFEWLGNLLGRMIRFVVSLAERLLSGLRGAFSDFFSGLTGAVGISPTLFNVVWLVLGLLLLYAAVRAFLARAIVAGIVWLVLAVFVLSALMG
ncbi:hypothetical protein [Chitinasiproducens palmae]|uniref:Uncharacterized protein n=1 Tax=Chitinasiproducens palmae TaxID=1770053 RepID=A0A1H2PTS4_9BURK|nr:hypothetical protein [Chitinasiproducens palmae]SDV50528.1 hypothetical protein SAMN05216551_11262 [Chitinasiproducens palmae]